MNCYFNKCYEAIDNCIKNNSFSFFYSEKNDADVNMHLHECCEILLCLSGGKSFFINDRIYEVNDGDIFLISQFETHKITTESEKIFKRYVFKIHPLWLLSNSTEFTDISRCFYKRGDNISHKISLNEQQKKLIINYFETLKNNEDYGDDLIKKSVVIQFLVKLNYFFKQYNKDYNYVAGSENLIIEKIIQYINSNLSNSISLDTLSKYGFISKNHLCRLFKKHIGTSVTKYITTRRITEAKRLLKNGLSVSEVAVKCGFNDYSHFLRTFKEIVGISPGKYSK